MPRRKGSSSIGTTASATPPSAAQGRRGEDAQERAIWGLCPVARSRAGWEHRDREPVEQGEVVGAKWAPKDAASASAADSAAAGPQFGSQKRVGEEHGHRQRTHAAGDG